MLSAPPIQFAVRDGAHIAFQVAGTGPPDLVFVAGSMATSLAWEDPVTARAFRRLASFSRLITYDQRGTGYSDRFDTSAEPAFEELVDDLDAVMTRAETHDPVLFGSHNGGAVAAAYAAGHPLRQLVLCNTWARLEWAEDFPIGFNDVILDRLEKRYQSEWGEGRIYNEFAPRKSGPPPGDAELASTSQNQLVTIFRINRRYDVRAVLPNVETPTLVLHMAENMNVPAAHGRFVADAIPGARLVLLPGSDHLFLRNHAAAVIDEVEEFVTGRHTPFTDRVRMTMLFTDIVNSTPLAVSVGDENWSALIEEHNDRVRQQVAAHGGQDLKSTGDGFLVAFEDAPAAVRCAFGAMAAVADLGLELRAGVHSGDVALMDKSDLSGIAVHVAQRLCAGAEGGQVLASKTVVDECADSGITFEDRGEVSLKGLPDPWEVFAARVDMPLDM